MFGLVVLATFFMLYLGPNILGDTPTYLSSIEVMNGGHPAAGFMPNRLMTTFLGLESIRVLSHVLGGILPAWFWMNMLLYFLAAIFFYKLLDQIFRSARVAFSGGLFLMANYGFLLFGLNYLMDIGGWAFYIFSLYFLYKHVQSRRSCDLLYSALMVGVGGLFKEYAFLGVVAIAIFVILDERKNVAGIFKKGIQTAALALIPTAIIYAWVYHKFGYSYLDWFGANKEHYVYASRLLEYFKSLGSLFNFLVFPVLAGVGVLISQWKSIEQRVRSFIIAAAVSSLPVFFWPAITQRILTITVPFAIILAGFAFKKWNKLWRVWGILLILYTLATFFMDSYILLKVNI